MQHVVCHLVRSDSSVFRLAELKSQLFCFTLLGETIEPMKDRRKPEYPEKTTDDKFKTEHSSPNRDSNPHSGIGGRLGKQTC